MARQGMRRALVPLGTCGLLGAAALWLYGDVFAHAGPFDRDELVWLRGDTLGSPWRHTQHWLIRDLGVPLFGPSRTGFQALALAIHLAGAVIVGWVVLLLHRVGQLGRDLPRRGVAIAAMAAALIYLAYDSGAPRWMAALSYELVVVTTLAALACTLRHRETGHPGWWAGVVAACGLGLVTHVFAVGTPLLVGLLEAALPPRNRRQGTWRGAALRYAGLLAPLAVFLVVYRHDLVGQGRAADAGGGVGATVALAVEHLGLTVLRIWGGRPDLFRLDLGWGSGAALAAGLLLGLAALGIRSMLQRRSSTSVPALLTVFVLAFGAVAFVPTLAAPGTLAVGWRFAFGGSGLAAALGGCWLALAGPLTRRTAEESPMRLALTAVPALLAALLLLASPQGMTAARSWSRIARGDAQLLDQTLWLPDSVCGRSLTRPPESELLEAVDTAPDLTCMDLASRDMAGLDLSDRTLTSADLTGAELTGADLRDADLQRASLLWARLDGADLRGTDLRDASLDGADLADADLRGALLEGASLHGAELRRADLRDLDLSSTDLTEADLADARLEGARLPR